ncbi:hypothetical protein AAG906_015866 [Vitis piasezkii]
MRYSKYLQLFNATFVFSILYLSAGTCIALIIIATRLELRSRSVLDRRHYSHRVLHLNMGGVNLKGGHNLILEIPANGGMLTALYAFHGRDVSRALLGLTSLFVIINAVSSFQIDDQEAQNDRVAWLPNWVFGVVGMLLGGASIAAGIYVI